MYDNILIPIAPGDAASSSPAFDVARRLLRDGGTITAITVLEVPPAYVADYLSQSQSNDVQAKEKARLDAELSEVAGAEVRVLKGHPARAILDEAARIGADCIAITAQRSSAREFLLGSTAARVARRASCTVVVVR
ncbi:universal stress protein [Aliiroseovarius crassostreae]|uniref:universal stress protein n=1 Tax=Aliiroseovarius crassostreae TaxID=154981 RepID=UPI003C7C9FB8